MCRMCMRFVAACGVIAGTVLACPRGKAEEPVSGRADAGKAHFLTPNPAAGPREPQGPAASALREKPTAESLTVLKSGPDHVRVVYRLKNKPATDMDRVLQQLFRLEGGLHNSAATTAGGPASSGVVIVPIVIDNSLVISGSPEAVDEVRVLLDKLDQPPRMLLLEMEIGVAPLGEAKPAESPSKLKEKSPPATAEPFRLLQRPAKMETTAHVRLITLDNQPAFVQLGSRVPRVTSLSASPTGGATRSITLDNVGLIVGATPRIDPDGAVTMQIERRAKPTGGRE